MNTTRKGDKLEDQVYSVFHEEILNDRFFAKSECCKIFKKKGYYSRDREKNIFFDVSIEVSLPGENTYSILVLIECKNYNHAVPVDDIEEFYAKTQQISGCNVKGIIATTNSFQEGAFNFSKSKGIGLLRHFSKENLDWILTRSPSSISRFKTTNWSNNNVFEGLYVQEYRSRIFDCYCYSYGFYSNSINEFSSTLLSSDLDLFLQENLHIIRNCSINEKFFVPFIEETEIETCALNILTQHMYKSGPVPLDEICLKLQADNNLEYDPHSTLEPGVLGQISYGPFKISIDNKQTESIERFRFTLAHELGHFYLGHNKYMSGEKCYENDIDIENPRDISIKDIQRLEWQANQFASFLLLPKHQFRELFLSTARERNLVDKGFGLIFLDNQQCNVSEYYNVTMPLIHAFKVSRSVVKIRLKKMGFLNEDDSKIGNSRNLSFGLCKNIIGPTSQ